MPELPSQLAVPDIDGADPGGAVLEQTIGKSAGGRAEIDGIGTANLEAKMLKGVFQFKAAAADVFVSGLNGQ